MAKARSRTAARKVKDKWKAKNWYQILSPTLFDNIPVAETLAEAPHQLMGRVTEVSMQDITNDFRKSHIKLFFKVDKVESGNAYTHFEGHTLTSDYLRRLIRRRKSRVDGVYDVSTKDGASLRVKPFAITEKRIQNSQKKVLRTIMKDTVTKEGKSKTLNEFLRDIFEGKTGSEMYKNCKNIYPVKRIEIYKSEMIQLPTVEMEEKPVKKEKAEEPEKKEEKTEKTKKAPAKKPKAKTTRKTTVKKPKTKAKTATKAKKAPAKKPKAKTTKKTTAKKKTTASKKKKPAKK
jgi:small subunit ribosomal protein S3Ae